MLHMGCLQSSPVHRSPAKGVGLTRTHQQRIYILRAHHRVPRCRTGTRARRGVRCPEGGSRHGHATAVVGRFLEGRWHRQARARSVGVHRGRHRRHSSSEVRHRGCQTKRRSERSCMWEDGSSSSSSSTRPRRAPASNTAHGLAPSILALLPTTTI